MIVTEKLNKEELIYVSCTTCKSKHLLAQQSKIEYKCIYCTSVLARPAGGKVKLVEAHKINEYGQILN